MKRELLERELFDRRYGFLPVTGVLGGRRAPIAAGGEPIDASDLSG